jgi:hypothetical protein
MRLPPPRCQVAPDRENALRCTPDALAGHRGQAVSGGSIQAWNSADRPRKAWIGFRQSGLYLLAGAPKRTGGHGKAIRGVASDWGGSPSPRPQRRSLRC